MVDYLKIVLSDLRLDEPTWPLPPTTIYTPYSSAWWAAGYENIAEMDDGGTDYTISVAFFRRPPLPVGQIQLIYKGYRAGGSNFAMLDQTNTDFYAAYLTYNLTGVWTGIYGETWTITHYTGVDALDLPSGEGGDEDLIFDNPTPLVQLGGVPPIKAATPTPAHDATQISLRTAQTSWVEGS